MPGLSDATKVIEAGGGLAATLHPYRGLFYPTVFDSLRIRQLKLYPPQRVPHLPQSEGE